MSFRTLPYDIVFSLLEAAAIVSPPSTLLALANVSKEIKAVYAAHEESLLRTALLALTGPNFKAALRIARREFFEKMDGGSGSCLEEEGEEEACGALVETGGTGYVDGKEQVNDGDGTAAGAAIPDTEGLVKVSHPEVSGEKKELEKDGSEGGEYKFWEDDNFLNDISIKDIASVLHTAFITHQDVVEFALFARTLHGVQFGEITSADHLSITDIYSLEDWISAVYQYASHGLVTTEDSEEGMFITTVSKPVNLSNFIFHKLFAHLLAMETPGPTEPYFLQQLTAIRDINFRSTEWRTSAYMLGKRLVRTK